MQMEIKVGKPTFVLPQFTGQYMAREASIAPEEYETAEHFRTLLDNNKPDEVLAELAKYYDIELSPAMLTLKAQIYFALKKYDQAEKTYLIVLSRMPQLVRAHSDLGQIYLIRNDYKKAREQFALAISYGSNEAIIHGQLAYLNLTTYGAYSAISEYQQAMALEPENPQWQQGLLASLTQAGMFEAANALVEELLAKHPRDDELWLNRAAISLKMHDTKGALTGLEMALLLGNKDPNNLKTAAQLHLQLGSYDRALELLKMDLSKTSFDMSTLNEYLSWMAQADRWNEASDLLNSVAGKVDKMSQRDQSAYFLQRAKVYKHQNKVSSAKSDFEKSLDLDPTNGDALLAYAKFESDNKNYVRAEMLYARAEGIDGKEKQALLGKAQLYIDMQDYKAALPQMRAALLKYPDLLELKDSIEVVENILRAKQSAHEN